MQKELKSQKNKLPSFKKHRRSIPEKVAWGTLWLIFPPKDRVFRGTLFRVSTFVFLVLVSMFWWITKDLPTKNLTDRDIDLTTKIYDRNGKLLYNIYADKNRTLLPFDQIPQNIKSATIAIEDKDFYKHKGFDILGVIRAATSIVFKQELQGGSTITQQLVKTAFLSPERNLTRKIKELYLSYQVESKFSKNQILEMYLNEVPYGGTAYGIEAASQTYFGKKVSELNLGESALIAGLPQSPTTYSPFGNNPKLAKQRQAEVLRRMVEDKTITAEESEKAISEVLIFSQPNIDIKAPHFVLFIKDQLAQKYGDALVEQGGLKVTTTLDLDIQETAQDAVTTEVAKLKSYNVGNGAAMVTNPKTGEILAMVGSRDYFDTANDGNVNVTTSLRQPGSSIKPINYAGGLMNGLTAGTVIVDGPVTFKGTPPYTPKNYDGKFHGAVTFRKALANSYNIPAVKVLAYNTVPFMLELAQKMGITTFGDSSRHGLSLTLGGGEVKMIEMTTAFSAFANKGITHEAYGIIKVEDKDGKILEEHLPENGKQAIPEEVAFIISHILADNQARADAFGTGSQLNIPGKVVSVKTGTTDDIRDNWTIGFTPSYLTAVWVGNNDNKPLNRSLTSGVTGAAPIWNKIMKSLLKNKEIETLVTPENVVSRATCVGIGEKKDDGTTSCKSQIEFYVKGTEPKNEESKFVKGDVWFDPKTRKIVQPGTAEAIEKKDAVVVTDFYQPGEGYCINCVEEDKPEEQQ